MTVYDQWHKEPGDGEQPCKCGRGRNRLYPAAGHLSGARWQVRWRDPVTGKQRTKSFRVKEGKNPAVHADAYDAEIAKKLLTPHAYVDPDAGNVTLMEYAEKLRKGRKIPNPETAGDLEGRLRLHVYEGDPDSGLTPREAPSIGQHPMGLLAARPSLVAAWAAAIPLSPIRARHVMGDVSFVFRVGIADGIVHRDPLHLEGVEWPEAGPSQARSWSLAQADGMRAELPGRFRVLVDLGIGTGMRQGEMLGLGVDDVDWLKRDDPRVHVVRQLRWIDGSPHFKPLKNEKKHHPPLSPELKRRLSRHLDQYPAREVTLPWFDPEDKERHGKPVTIRLMVTSEAGKAVERHVLMALWGRARRRAKITPEGERERDDGCHALRHTAASTWLRAGIDVVRVASWLGDTVKTVVETYAHLMPGGGDDDGRAAVDAFWTVPGDGACAPDVHHAAAAGRSGQVNGQVLLSPHVSSAPDGQCRSRDRLFD